MAANATLPTRSIAPDAEKPTEAKAEISYIDWIDKVIYAHGTTGMSPPEILTEAGEVGIKMHQNYPYVALKSLIKKGAN